MKIMLVPIDERPCNYNYPMELVESNAEIELIIPPKEYLGNKKNPADTERVWDFVFTNCRDVDGFILSSEMLMYGGLIPSRLHHLDYESIDNFIGKIKELSEKTANKTIYISSMIMRNQQFNYNDEEPDYYLDYGSIIFERSVLLHKEVLGEDVADKLSGIEGKIPEKIIADVERRRAFNLELTKKLLYLVENEIIDFMVIPQDDSYPYGYTAQDQSKVRYIIKDLNLEQRVMIYPGADEVGQTLLSRMYLKSKNKEIKVYSLFSNEKGRIKIPLYEDRTMESSLQSHLNAAGCRRVRCIKDADYILAINAPGEEMQEASVQFSSSLKDDNNNNISGFVSEIEMYVSEGYPVAIVDKAYCNGGDIDFVKALDQADLLGSIIAYNAWNTYCNSLGSSISQANINLRCTYAADRYIKKRVIEDLIYQSIVRWDLVNNYINDFGGNYFDIKNCEKKVEKKAEELIISYSKKFKNLNIDFKNLRVSFPWKRMFEIKIDL